MATMHVTSQYVDDFIHVKVIIDDYMFDVINREAYVMTKDDIKVELEIEYTR